MSKKIYLYSDKIGFVDLVDKFTQNAALKTVNSARISYAKQKEKLDQRDLKLIDFLYNHNHVSPFRHSLYTFHLKLPLFVFRQLIKHQVGCSWQSYEVNGQEVPQDLYLEINDLMFDTDKGCSWNEMSLRYVKAEPQFFVPAKFRSNSGHANKQASSDLDKDFDHSKWAEAFDNHNKAAYEVYNQAIEAGIAREQARMLLPTSIYTECYWTVSLQALFHFFSLRDKPDAQEEIRVLAQAIKQILETELQEFFNLNII